MHHSYGSLPYRTPPSPFGRGAGVREKTKLMSVFPFVLFTFGREVEKVNFIANYFTSLSLVTDERHLPLKGRIKLNKS
jgi:hypothetical protein